MILFTSRKFFIPLGGMYFAKLIDYALGSRQILETSSLFT